MSRATLRLTPGEACTVSTVHGYSHPSQAALAPGGLARTALWAGTAPFCSMAGIPRPEEGQPVRQRGVSLRKEWLHLDVFGGRGSQSQPRHAYTTGPVTWAGPGGPRTASATWPILAATPRKSSLGPRLTWHLPHRTPLQASQLCCDPTSPRQQRHWPLTQGQGAAFSSAHSAHPLGASQIPVKASWWHTARTNPSMVTVATTKLEK